MSSTLVCCHQTAKAPDDVMVGAVGEPRFGVEQWRPRWRIAVEMGLSEGRNGGRGKGRAGGRKWEGERGGRKGGRGGKVRKGREI